MKNHDVIQIITLPIFKIVLKVDKLIPQFLFTFKFSELGALIENNLHLKNLLNTLACCSGVESKAQLARALPDSAID